MKIAVTGANGFIGQVLCKRLVNNGDEVVKVPRELLYNSQKLQRFFKKERPQKVYHLAAYGNHASHAQDAYVFDANVTPLLNVIKNMFLMDFELVNVSTSSVDLPNQTMYSIAKRAGESICQYYAKNFNFNIRSVRPYSVYGPGEAEHRLIPILIKFLHLPKFEWQNMPANVPFETPLSLMLTADAHHDWIHVDDFVESLINTQKLYVGTGESYSNLEILRMLELIAGVKDTPFLDRKLRDYDTQDWKSPESVPHRSIWQGLIETYHHYRAKYATTEDLGPEQKA